MNIRKTRWGVLVHRVLSSFRSASLPFWGKSTWLADNRITAAAAPSTKLRPFLRSECYPLAPFISMRPNNGTSLCSLHGQFAKKSGACLISHSTYHSTGETANHYNNNNSKNTRTHFATKSGRVWNEQKTRVAKPRAAVHYFDFN